MNSQTIPRVIATLTYAAGTGFDVLLDKLLLRIGRSYAHLVGFTFEAIVTPTYTAAPTVVGLNSLVKSMTFHDGRVTRALFSGGWNELRMFERLEHGGSPYSDPLTNGGTGNPRYFIRHYSLGPRRLDNGHADFALPAAALTEGRLSGTWGALTDLSADTTANTATVNVIAHYVMSEKLRVGLNYERSIKVITNDSDIGGEGQYLFLALGNSGSFDAFAAGDIGTVQLTTSDGVVMPAVDPEVLSRCYQADFAPGELGGIMGEPRNATYDVAARTVNGGTPTALQAQALDLQPVIWTPPGGSVNRLAYSTRTTLGIKTGGSQSSFVAYVGRLLPQGGDQLGPVFEAAGRKLDLSGLTGANIGVATRNGQPYTGSREAKRFMPWEWVPPRS